MEKKSQRQFVIINTHLDHVSQEARENQARLINEWAEVFPQECPLFLTGDMNCDRHNATIKSFFQAGWKDTYEAVHGCDEAGHTFHRFRGADYPSDKESLARYPETINKIDWLFYKGPVKVSAAEIIRDCIAGRFPSDHYFVSADVEF